jgi:hypothetical protein
LVVEQDILQLQVPVGNALFLHVGNDIEQLCQEKPSRIFAHATEGLT